ncbi:hypothetical protein [Scytonema sp. NUACC21]
MIAVGAKPTKPKIPGIEHALTWRSRLKLGASKQDLDMASGIHPSSGEELFTI